MVRTVLLTGASSGVGLETAVHLADLGFRVVGTVHTEDKIESLVRAARDHDVEVEATVLDVTDAARCETVVQTAEPWALVNNAAYMNVGLVEDVPPEEALRQLEALVVAPMRLATLALPGMRTKGGGRIVNVSSVAAHATAAMTGWYQACKHALSAVTDALRREVASDGVDVVLVEPGGLRTGIWDKARDDLLRRRRASTSPAAYDRAVAVLERIRPFMGEPAAAAAVIGKALTADRPRARYRVGAGGRGLEIVHRVLPGGAVDRINRAALGR